MFTKGTNNRHNGAKSWTSAVSDSEEGVLFGNTFLQKN